MAKNDSTLSSRDFGSRPRYVLGGGIAGFLTATTHLEVIAGQVTRRSRMKSVSFEASTLTIERRGTSNLFVIAPREAQRKVLCTFPDEDVDHVREAFTAAGVEYVASDSVPEAEPTPAS
jgi:hypothetical protein